MTNEKQYHDLEEQIRAVVRVPGPNPEFAAHLRGRLDRLAVSAEQPRPGPYRRYLSWTRLSWAVGLALAVIIIAGSMPGVASAIRQLFSYFPGIGLVEQNTPRRVLEAPIAMTRDGITLTIQQVIAYADRVELAYRVDGLSVQPEGQPDASVCNGPDMYPNLEMPDGSRIEARPVALGGERLATGYTAGHAFDVPIPPGVDGAAFQLKCLQEATRGVAPEDWVVPFQLVAAPQDQPVGKLLEPGNAPVRTQSAESDVTFTFLGGALEENGYHFFFRFSANNNAPDFLAVRPTSMYLIDSNGQRVELINALPWSPFDYIDVWEYRAVATPAPGPVNIHIDGVDVFYLAQEASFTFSPGKEAQVGQSWKLDEHFAIGGYNLVVTAAEMVEREGHRGFEFVIETNQPEVNFSAELMDMHPTSERFSMWSITGKPAPASVIKTGFLYETDVPETLQATFNTIYVPVDGAWSIDWIPSQP